MLSQIDQKKIKFKLKNIYKYHLSETEISECYKEITKLINKFNKKKNKKKRLFQRKHQLLYVMEIVFFQAHKDTY